MGIAVGKSIPHFQLPDQDGTTFSSREALKYGPLVIFFYPKDYTPGCTAEVCSFRDSIDEFQEFNATVVGISSDSENMHQKFANKHNLPYPLLSDHKGSVAKSFDVKKRFFNLLPGRETFVVDQDGIIQMSYADIRAGDHRNKALETLKNIA